MKYLPGARIRCFGIILCVYIHTRTYIVSWICFQQEANTSKQAQSTRMSYANNNSSEKNSISELISLKRDARLQVYNRPILHRRLPRYHITYSCYLPRHAPIKKYKNHKIHAYFLFLFLQNLSCRTESSICAYYVFLTRGYNCHNCVD